MREMDIIFQRLNRWRGRSCSPKPKGTNKDLAYRPRKEQKWGNSALKLLIPLPIHTRTYIFYFTFFKS